MQIEFGIFISVRVYVLGTKQSTASLRFALFWQHKNTGRGEDRTLTARDCGEHHALQVGCGSRHLGRLPYLAQRLLQRYDRQARDTPEIAVAADQRGTEGKRRRGHPEIVFVQREAALLAGQLN